MNNTTINALDTSSALDLFFKRHDGMPKLGQRNACGAAELLGTTQRTSCHIRRSVMKLVRRYASFAAGAIIVALATTNVVFAQTYPARSVRVIVPFARGGAVAIIGRPIRQELSKRLGQQFYVENVPGASGNIGTAQAAKAAPDGSPLLLAFSSHATNPSMFDKLPF